jgi:transcriptional regulator with GAF, ATPase, and Fis domain
VPPYHQSIESELFGHVKELTSAVKDRAGKFEAADKGTIFR